MLLSARISTNELARLCRRIGIALDAGVDVRTVFAREAERGTRPATRSRLRMVSEGINNGESLGEALVDTHDYFPEMFHELAHVGEKTGHLGESFIRLAEHYEEQIKLRRVFLVACAWPIIELALALTVIGVMIWVMGIVNRGNSEPIDPLGLGLMGNSGLMIYLTFLAFVGLGLFLIVQALLRGLVWTRPIQRALLCVPMLGGPLQTIALARMAWAMHLTLDAGMALRRALKLSLKSTRNARYTDHIRPIDASIEEGNTICEAFADTYVFPADFLDAVRVGEQTGTLVESMGRLSRQYREKAAAAFKVMAVLGGFAVWLLVAVIIIMMIFSLAMFYIGTLNSLTS